VQVLDDEQHRLALGLAQHDAGDGGEDPPPALGRLHALPLGVVGRDVAEREDRGHRPVQLAVELEQAADDLAANAAHVVGGLDLEVVLEALDRHRAVRLDLDVAVGRPPRRVGDERGAGPGQLLHARGQVGGLPDRAVLHVEVVADRAHHDVAGVDAHADLHVDALAPAQLLGVLRQRAVHAQRRVAGAHGMVLVGHRRAEQRQDAVAHDLVDGCPRSGGRPP
jgi:hypothetical protein